MNEQDLKRDLAKAKERIERQSRELENTKREAERFSFIVSHDLRAPLRAVSWLAAWLAREYAEKFDEEGKAQVKLLLERVRRMNDLIDGVREHSRTGQIREEKTASGPAKQPEESIGRIAPPRRIEIKKDKEPARSGAVKILAVEDDVVDQLAFKRLVKENNLPYEYVIANSVAEAERILRREKFDVIVTDYVLGDGTSFDIFPLAKDTPVIVATGTGDEETAAKAMRIGAYDYLIKDTGYHYLSVLPLTVANAIKHKGTEDQVKKLSQAVERSASIVMITDAEGRIEYVNPRFSEVTGYDPSEAIGKTPRILKSGRTPPERYEDLWRTIASGRIWRGEFQNRKKSGELYWAHLSVAPIKNEGAKITHYVGVHEDITERKEAEEKLRSANEELLQSERNLKRALEDVKRSHEELKAAQLRLIQTAKLEAVGKLAAGIAHEVKNPLAILLLGVQRLSKDLEGVPQSAEVLPEMTAAIRHANAILRGLLDFSACTEVKLEACDLHALIDETLLLVKHSLEQNRISAEKQFSVSLPLLPLDRNKIHQVFLNLFMNAGDAMPEGGALTIRTYEKELSAGDFGAGRRATDRFKTGEKAVIAEVEDSGPGIPERALEKIFDPFFTTKPSGRGTGLGLAVTRNIMELHQGSIWIENRKEGGARAVLIFKTDREGRDEKKNLGH